MSVRRPHPSPGPADEGPDFSLGAPTASERLLIVPGNPGLARLYLPFARRILDEVGDLQIRISSLLGHVTPVPAGTATGLEAQVAHQAARLADWVEAGSRVHVAGHSIGAWIGLRVFERIPPPQQGRLLLLLPTLERMAETPSGRQLAPWLRLPQAALPSVVGLATRIPGHTHVLRHLLLARAVPAERSELLRGLLELTPDGLRHVLELAREELRTVRLRPDDRLEAHRAHLSIAYGAADGWNTPDMPDALAHRHPGIEVWRCPPEVGHAFVLQDASVLASWVAHRVAAPLRPRAPTEEGPG